MVNKLKFIAGKSLAKVLGPFSSLGSGSGKSFAGIVFSKVAGLDAISDLSKELKIGSVIITGTNGKTTTTTLLIKLLSTDIPIRSSFESNTINAIASVNGIEDENKINVGQQLFIPKFVY